MSIGKSLTQGIADYWISLCIGVQSTLAKNSSTAQSHKKIVVTGALKTSPVEALLIESKMDYIRDQLAF